MRAQLQCFGNSESPVVVVDDFTGDAEQTACIADSLAPFPPITGAFYPGVRRIIGEADRQAYSYVLDACERAAPFIAGAFGVQGFDLREASFSVVATPPEQLQPVQRSPHFDSSDPNLVALLHYLRVPPKTGTAFYRHRSTGIERVTSANLDRFVAAANRELAESPPDPCYFNGSNQFFEQIGCVEALPDRLVMYHGNMLHSGVIPPGMTLSPDPREGRLTANLFIIGRAT